MVSLRKAFPGWWALSRLRRGQLRGKISRRLRPLLLRPGRLQSITGMPLPPPMSVLPEDFSVVPPMQSGIVKERLQEGHFTFCNVERRLGWLPDWEPDDVSTHWLNHLHSHDWFWSLPFAKARAAALHWYNAHGPAWGRVGWEPYPTSLRLMNWTALFWGYWRRRTLGDRASATVLWASLRVQAEWLMRNVEHGHMGMRLFENACALAFVGAVFDGELAARWKKRGGSILKNEIPEQILADGLHFERSPMLQCRLAQLLLWLHATGDTDLMALVSEPLRRIMTALWHVSHPDGRVALLNESVHGRYPTVATLLRQAERQGLYYDEPHPGIFAQPLAGYYGARSKDGDYLICDAGVVGPDYVDRCAHADILSFELSVGGKRMLVDSGSHGQYENDLGEYCRSTRGHNTVEINGEDQCYLLSDARLGFRGRPRDLRYKARPENVTFKLDAWHDGYQRLKGSPRHRRRFHFESRLLMIQDVTEAATNSKVAARLHLHPHCEIHTMTENTVGIEREGVVCHLRFSGDGWLGLEKGWYCPQFGQKQESQVLVWKTEGRRCSWKTQIEW